MKQLERVNVRFERDERYGKVQRIARELVERRVRQFFGDKRTKHTNGQFGQLEPGKPLEVAGCPGGERLRDVQAAIGRQPVKQRELEGGGRRPAARCYEAHADTIRAPCGAIGEM